MPQGSGKLGLFPTPRESVNFENILQIFGEGEGKATLCEQEFHGPLQNLCGSCFFKFMSFFWSLQLLGHTPNKAGTFWEEFRKNSGKTPETLSDFACNSPREYGWETPSRTVQGIWSLQSISRILSLSVQLGTSLFQKWLQRGPLRAGHAIPSSTEGISELRPVPQPRHASGGHDSKFMCMRMTLSFFQRAPWKRLKWLPCSTRLDKVPVRWGMPPSKFWPQ